MTHTYVDHPEPGILSAPEDEELYAASLRVKRAVDGITENLYRRKDAGFTDVLPALCAIGFLLLELGFTVAEEGGIDCRDIEATIARAYDLPGYTTS